jgi:predicted metallo-beta-lactamase superfamily hydrolase
LENLNKILEKTNVKVLVLDHHLLRDLNWRVKMESLLRKAEELGVDVKSASEFAGKPENLLEARRKELYQKSLD